MQLNWKIIGYWIIGVIIAFLILGGVISMRIECSSAFRAAAGLILLLIPGLTLTFVIWPVHKLNTLERVLIASVLSMAALPLISFILYKFGLHINTTNTILSSIIIIIVSLGLILLRKKFTVVEANRKS
jgi:uncharacterized membrane protein